MIIAARNSIVDTTDKVNYTRHSDEGTTVVKIWGLFKDTDGFRIAGPEADEIWVALLEKADITTEEACTMVNEYYYKKGQKEKEAYEAAEGA